MFTAYIAEFIGTILLVLLGDGVCASLSLDGSLFKGAGPIYTMLGWGLAVMLPAMAFGTQSAAHFNPALTISLAVIGAFPWSGVLGYIVAQMLGGFVGAILVYVVFHDQFKLTLDNGAAKEDLRGIFCTGPAIRNLPMNVIGEAFATFALVFFIVSIGTGAKLVGDVGLNYFFVYGIIMSCGFSLGSTTGFAMNPARDTSPRLAYAVLFHGDADWGYAWVPIVGSLIGGIVGALLASYTTALPALATLLG